MKSSLYFLDGFKFCRTTYISTIFCFQNLHPISLAFLTTTTTKSSDAHACLLSRQGTLIFVAGNVLKAVDEKTWIADLRFTVLCYLLLRDHASHRTEGMDRKAECRLRTLLLLIRYILEMLMYCIEIGDSVWEENDYAFHIAHRSNFWVCFLLAMWAQLRY